MHAYNFCLLILKYWEILYFVMCQIKLFISKYGYFQLFVGNVFNLEMSISHLDNKKLYHGNCVPILQSDNLFLPSTQKNRKPTNYT